MIIVSESLAMVPKDDWRRMGQEKYLIEVELQYIEQYTPFSETWEHEHCAFCTEKISTYQGDLHSGYCTTDDKQSQWICPVCFDDFKDEFRWKIRIE